MQTATRNYTLKDVNAFFQDIGYPTGIAMRESVPPVFSEIPPNVPVMCLHGSGINTPITYTYQKGTFPDGPPLPIFSDGDGTVSRNSLEGCSRWKDKQNQTVVIKDFNHGRHNGILRSKELISFVTDFLYNGEF